MKHNKANNFFSASEKQAIGSLVKKTELSTSGEIAVMVVDDSDSYREAETLGALLLSAFIALIISISIQHVTIWSYIPSVLVFWFPARYLMCLFPQFKFALAGKTRQQEAVRERAVRAFFEKELYRTRDETGILVFISILERKVWIIGDRGINQRVDQQAWLAIAGELAGKIKEGLQFEGVYAAIEKLGGILAEHFPKKDDDTNELPDEIIA